MGHQWGEYVLYQGAKILVTRRSTVMIGRIADANGKMVSMPYPLSENSAMLSSGHCLGSAHVNKEHVMEQKAKDQSPTVIVIDDDPGIRESLGRFLRAAGFRVDLFGSVNEFLDASRPEGPTCLVLDVRLPGQTGLEFQRELASAKRQLPIIFITGHGDIPMTVQAMKGGAIEFLTKPFREQDLLEAIHFGHARDRAWI